MTGSGGDTGALEVSQVSQGAMATKFDIAAVVGMKEKHKQQPLIMLPRLLPQCRVGWRSGGGGWGGGSKPHHFVHKICRNRSLFVF